MNYTSAQANKLLKKLSKLLQADTHLSSYVSRHTWATTARNCDIPLSVISAGLGHRSQATTQIYLASLEDSTRRTAKSFSA